MFELKFILLTVLSDFASDSTERCSMALHYILHHTARWIFALANMLQIDASIVASVNLVIWNLILILVFMKLWELLIHYLRFRCYIKCRIFYGYLWDWSYLSFWLKPWFCVDLIYTCWCFVEIDLHNLSRLGFQIYIINENYL